MVKKTIKITVLIMSCTIILSLFMPIVGIKADEFDTPVEIEDDLPYQYVNGVTCQLYISSGTATVISSVEGKSGVSSTSVTVYLEKYENDDWQTCASWNHSGGRNQNNTDTTSVNHGLYRARLSVTASTSDGNSESFDVTGNTVLYWL